MMAENGKRERGKRKGKGKAEDKVVLLELIKSDAVTGQYKEGNVVTSYEMPQEYQQAFNNAWNVSVICMYILCTLR